MSGHPLTERNLVLQYSVGVFLSLIMIIHLVLIQPFRKRSVQIVFFLYELANLILFFVLMNTYIHLGTWQTLSKGLNLWLMVTSFIFWIALQKTHWIEPNSLSPPGSREAHYETVLAKNKIKAQNTTDFSQFVSGTAPEKRETSGGEERNFLGIVNDTE